MFDWDTFIGRFIVSAIGIVAVLAVTAPPAFICTWLAAHNHFFWAIGFMVVYTAAAVSLVTLFLDRN